MVNGRINGAAVGNGSVVKKNGSGIAYVFCRKGYISLPPIIGIGRRAGSGYPLLFSQAVYPPGKLVGILGGGNNIDVSVTIQILR